jgi:hypothetical protein
MKPSEHVCFLVCAVFGQLVGVANPGDVVAEAAVLKGSAPASAEAQFDWRSVSGWDLRIHRKLLET